MLSCSQPYHFVSVGGAYLSEALRGAGFKDILDTDQHQFGKNEVRLHRFR